MKSNDKLKEIDIKSSAYYYSNKITKLQNFDLDNVLIDETSYKSVLVYCVFGQIKQRDLLEFVTE